MKNNYLHFVLVGLLLLFGTTISAQQLTGDISKQNSGTVSGSVKLIDNKGTIKYLQVANGLTSLTNTTLDKTTTTWQLGGSLTDDTYIDVNGQVFGLDGISLAASNTASVDAIDGSSRGTGTGWTLLVRDEATGAIQKLKATDLVQSGHTTKELDADASTDIIIPATGVSPSFKQVWVYRNGAKLIANTDYTVSENQVTVLISSLTEAYNDDFFEVHWIK